MHKSGRALLLLFATLWLTGCTAMMVGGGTGGGYEPPKDQCEEGKSGCKSG